MLVIQVKCSCNLCYISIVLSSNSSNSSVVIIFHFFSTQKVKTLSMFKSVALYLKDKFPATS